MYFAYKFVPRHTLFMCAIFLLLISGGANGAEGNFQQVEPETNVTISGVVFQDVNSNGTQDVGEPPVLGVNVFLHRIVNDQPLQRVTDVNGLYRFVLLPPPDGDNLYLQIDRDALLLGLAPYAITTKDKAGVDDNQDSDFDQLTGRTDQFFVERFRGGSAFQYDLGLIKIPECHNPMDIMITLDFSDDISGDYNPITQSGTPYINQFDLMKNFARTIVRGFNLGTYATHIGVAQFNRQKSKYLSGVVGKVEINLGQYVDQQQLISMIDVISVPNMSNLIVAKDIDVADLRLGLVLARTQLIRGIVQPTTIRHLPSTIIMVTDGRHTEEGVQDPVARATEIKSLGVRIFVVQLPIIDPRINPKSANHYAREIASDPDDKYLIPVNGGQRDLMGSLVNVINGVCNNFEENAPALNYFVTPTITLSWSAIAWAESYEIQVSDNARFDNEPIYSGTVASGSREVAVTLPDGIYSWRVRAVSSMGVGQWNVIGLFTVNAVS